MACRLADQGVIYFRSMMVNKWDPHIHLIYPFMHLINTVCFSILKSHPRRSSLTSTSISRGNKRQQQRKRAQADGRQGRVRPLYYYNAADWAVHTMTPEMGASMPDIAALPAATPCQRDRASVECKQPSFRRHRKSLPIKRPVRYRSLLIWRSIMAPAVYRATQDEIYGCDFEQDPVPCMQMLNQE